MPAKGILRVGVDNFGGGLITGSQSSKTTLGGSPIACVGATIAAHSSDPVHNATISGGSAKTTANGFAVAGAGDSATCGHTGVGGSSKTTYGT